MPKKKTAKAEKPGKMRKAAADRRKDLRDCGVFSLARKMLQLL